VDVWEAKTLAYGSARIENESREVADRVGTVRQALLENRIRLWNGP